ncbi:hypothetical protein ABGV42_00415 [Paenibacillus pabuli]|uniref:hypothetical protein n=1 Tax=Paenibacillus pabuli TaxID=1472 RepID=UPI0032426F78
MGRVELEYAMKDWLNDVLRIWDIVVIDTDDIDLGSYQYDEEIHYISMNLLNIIHLADKYSTTPLGLAHAVMSHELGHYVHYKYYNGIDMGRTEERATDEMVKTKHQLNLEIRAYNHGKEFISDVYSHVYEELNIQNINYYRRKLGMTEILKECHT